MKESNCNCEVENKLSNISIICPSPNGREIAIKLQKYFSAKLYIKESSKSLGSKGENSDINGNNININKASGLSNESNHNPTILENNIYYFGVDFSLSDVAREAMTNSQGIIFIASIGIAVRAISPFIKGKDKDPGVVVVDLSGKYAINILSGHLGGGNELTHSVAKILDAMPIITTASDNLGITAPDILAKENKLIIEDLKKAKYIAAQLIDHKIIGIKDDYNLIEPSKGYEKVTNLREDCIWITHNLTYIPEGEGNCSCDIKNNNYSNLDYSKILRLIRKDVVLGIGCRRGTTFEKLNEFINNNLEKYNLDIRAVAAIVSVEVKANEEGLVELAQKINCPFKTFSVEEIKTVQDKYDKSYFVEKTLGVTGVCEPCVDLAKAEVIISKIKHEGMTLAIGVLKGL